jgi:hypothetical protein
MKHLFFLFAISLPLILIGCSQDEEMSPLSFQSDEVGHHINKTSPTASYPFQLYQAFPELQGRKISWDNNVKGLVIQIGPSIKAVKSSILFAVVHFADVDPAMDAAKMVYLGSSLKKTYLIQGIKNRTVSSINIYTLNNVNSRNRQEPYLYGQLFNNIKIKGWSSADNMVKVSAEKFPPRLVHMFAELKSDEGNSLVFIGKPIGEDFEFPKSGKQRLRDLKIYGYVNSIKSLHPTFTE